MYRSPSSDTEGGAALQAHLTELYGLGLPPDFISTIDPMYLRMS